MAHDNEYAKRLKETHENLSTDTVGAIVFDSTIYRFILEGIANANGINLHGEDSAEDAPVAVAYVDGTDAENAER